MLEKFANDSPGLIQLLIAILRDVVNVGDTRQLSIHAIAVNELTFSRRHQTIRMEILPTLGTLHLIENEVHARVADDRHFERAIPALEIESFDLSGLRIFNEDFPVEYDSEIFAIGQGCVLHQIRYHGNSTARA